MVNRFPTHDDFIRNVLSNKKNVISYFKNCLSPYISTILDFPKIRQIHDTYISEDLRKTMSDMLFSCPLRGKKGAVKISLLIEHKSHPDKFTPIQIGGYIFSAFKKQIQNKEELSLVVPILLYHGKEKWEYKTLKDLFIGIDGEFIKYLPTFDFVNNNLGQIDDKEIENLNNAFLTASLLALKHSQENCLYSLPGDQKSCERDL